MTEVVANPARVALKDVRIAFANIFEPKAVEAGGKAKYSAAFILDPKAPYIPALEAAMVAVANAKWADKGPAVLKKLKEDKRVGFIRGPRVNKDGDPYDGFEGMFSVNTSADAAPTILDRDKSPLGPKSGRPYSGCYVNATIEAWAQDNDFGRRVNFTLRGVQFVRNGDAFGGGAPASADEFEDISATEEDLVG